MLVSEVLADVRLELTDQQNSRFQDADLMRLLKKGLRRLEKVICRNDIQQEKLVYEFTTIATISDYDLPDDYMTDVGLFKPTGVPLVKKTDTQWESVISSTEASIYIIRGNKIWIANTPQSSINMRLVYWPRLDVSDLALTDDMPYSGKFDDIVGDYVAIRAKNIDEMSLDFDTQLLQDLENNALQIYGTVAPTTVKMRGWCP